LLSLFLMNWTSIRESIIKIKGKLPNLSEEFFLFILIIFVALSSFALGHLSAKETATKKISSITCLVEKDNMAEYGIKPILTGGEIVASRKGSKYHFPWCTGAKQMSEQNKIWFKNIKEAKKHGYTAAGNCKGLE